MFTNIGKKIKILTLVLFWIQVAAYVITGLVFMIEGIDSYWGGDEMIITGFVIMVAGPLVSWIMSFFLYGFGELIDKSTETAKNTEILVAIASNQGQNVPQQDNAPQAPAYSQAPAQNQSYAQPQAYAAPVYAQPYAQPAPQRPAQAPQQAAPVYAQPVAKPVAQPQPAAPAAPAAPQKETADQ